MTEAALNRKRVLEAALSLGATFQKNSDAIAKSEDGDLLHGVLLDVLSDLKDLLAHEERLARIEARLGLAQGRGRR